MYVPVNDIMEGCGFTNKACCEHLLEETQRNTVLATSRGVLTVRLSGVL